MCKSPVSQDHREVNTMTDVQLVKDGARQCNILLVAFATLQILSGQWVVAVDIEDLSALLDHTMSGGDRSRQVERRSTARITFNTASIGIAGVGRTRRAMMAAGHTGEAQVEDTTTVEVECATPDHKHQVWTVSWGPSCDHTVAGYPSSCWATQTTETTTAATHKSIVSPAANTSQLCSTSNKPTNMLWNSSFIESAKELMLRMTISESTTMWQV